MVSAKTFSALNVVLPGVSIKCVVIFFYVCFPTVRGEWTPLVTLAEQCGYTIERQDADVVITAPFITCGITVQVIHFAGGNGLILKYHLQPGCFFFLQHNFILWKSNILFLLLHKKNL